jgi:hypothetical protein
LEEAHRQLGIVFDPLDDYDEGEDKLQGYISGILLSLEDALVMLRDLEKERAE